MKFKSMIGKLLLCTLISTQAFAAVDSFEIYDSKTKGIIMCKKIAGKWFPGKKDKKTKEIKTFQSKIKKIKTILASSAKKRPDLEQQLKTLKDNLPFQRRACKGADSIEPDPNVTPRQGDSTPKPTATNTPKATATPANSACSQWSAGQTKYNSCLGAGCHASKLTNRTTTMINNAFNNVPSMTARKSMFSSSDVTNIAAYLNSTLTSQCGN